MIDPKLITAKTILCNSCKNLKRHTEYKKVICHKSGVKAIRVEKCHNYIPIKKKKKKEYDALEWVYRDLQANAFL